MTDLRSARAEFYTRKTLTRGRPSVVEIRDAGSGQLTLMGYASITGNSYPVFDFLGEYDETVAVGAFAKSLQEQDDVRLLVNHDGIPMARTKSGTLTLREITDGKNDPQGRGQTGLWCEATLDAASPHVQSVKSAMDRGDMSEMSFAFQATRQEWNADYTARTVTELRLFDVSLVTYPANPATSATLTDARSDAKRELIFSLIDAGRALDDEQRQFVRDAIEQRDAMLCLNLTLEISDDEDDEDEGDDDNETVTPDDLEPDEGDGAAEPYPDDVMDRVERAETLAALRLESLKVDSKRTKK